MMDLQKAEEIIKEAKACSQKGLRMPRGLLKAMEVVESHREFEANKIDINEFCNELYEKENQ